MEDEGQCRCGWAQGGGLMISDYKYQQNYLLYGVAENVDSDHNIFNVFLYCCSVIQ